MTDYKKDFPLLAESDIAYLDNAATEQRPACVLDAEREFYERWNANPLRRVREKSFLPEIRPRASTWWRTAMRCPG